jgi:uncharacterized protein (TIGR03086 family)
MTGSTVIRMHLVEVLTHGWDLATATDQEPKLDPKLVTVALEFMQGMPTDLVRGGGFFGTDIPVDDSASAQDRLVAFLGRDPANPVKS